MWFILETRTGRHPFSLNPCLDYGKMHYTICHALRKVSMKFIKEKLSLLYPLFLLLFYFYIRPQFRPLAQYVSNSLASANSYYWTLFGLPIFQESPVFMGEEPASILARSCLCSLFGLLARLLYQWFCSRTGSCFESLSSRNQPDRSGHPSGRDGDCPAGDRRVDFSWGLGECLL